jgi:pilus assembly protein Flp/PilA
MGDMNQNVTAKEPRGQALVEYALILTMVALVVILVLTAFGPAIGNVFRGVTNNMAYQAPGAGSTTVPGSTAAPGNTAVPQTAVPKATPTSIAGGIVKVSAERTGDSNGNSVKVIVVVSAKTILSFVDSQGAKSVTDVACSETCEVVIPSVGKDAGYIAVVSADKGVATVPYPAKP